MIAHLKSIYNPANVSHILSCLALTFFTLVPFIGTWEFSYDGLTVYLRQGHGYVVVNVAIFIGLCSAGLLIGGSLHNFARILLHRHHPILFIFPLLIALIAQLGLSETISHTTFYIVGLSSFLASITYTLIKGKKSISATLNYTNIKLWLTKKSCVNFIFFTLLFLCFVINNILEILNNDISFLQSFSLIIGRFALYAGIIGLLAFLTNLLLRSLPSGLKWLLWGTLGLLPILVIIDSFMTAIINRRLTDYINEFGELTIAKIKENLAASSEGIKNILYSHPDWLLLLLGFLLFTLVAALTHYCFTASKKWTKQFSLINITILLIAGLSIATSEQALGVLWKSRQQRQQEYQLLPFQTGIFAPQRGVGTYNIHFKRTSSIIDEQLESPKQPDIYFFMVESMRADTITPKITPFLAKFRNQSCQPLNVTWAGSNATHLSWFSTFHSAPPVFWRSTVNQQENNKHTAGSPTLKWLKNQGYNLEIRAVCDLTYNQFGLTNFGKQGQLAHLIDHCSEGSKYEQQGSLWDREVFAFSQLRSALLKNKEGGNFYFTALDSPHYNYYWHNDFDPPFKDYVDNTSFPMSPSKEELQRYINRYWNACAWVDYQINEFVTFLKANGRYDNSIIVITGDHGEEFKEHGKWFHCSTVYDEQIKVPILIKWPKSQIQQPEVSNASHLDIMPSIMAHIGASDATLNKLQGENLLAATDQHTVITTTNYAGTNGITMVMRRGNYAAYFSWPQYWLGKVPEQFSLESILENDVPLALSDPASNLFLLKKLFPDAFERFISDISVAE